MIVLVILLTTVNLYVPLAGYTDQAKCDAALKALGESSDKFNTEIKLGCLPKEQIDAMHQRKDIPTAPPEEAPKGDDEPGP